MLKKLLALLGLALIIAIILIEDPTKIWDAVSNTNPLLLLAAEAFLLALSLSKGARLHQLAKTIKQLKFREALNVFCFGQLVNQGITTVLGEVSKGVMLKKLHGFSFSRSMSIIFVERGYDLIFTLAFSMLLLGQVKQSWAPLAIALPLLFIGAIIAIAVLPEKPFHWFKKFKKPWHFYENFRGGLRSLSTKVLATTLAITAVAWLFEGLGNQLLLSAFGVNLPLLTVLSVTSLSLLVGFLSGIPGGIGTREVSLVFLYSLFGVPAPIALALSLVYRIAIIVNDYAFYLLSEWKK